MGVEAPRRRRAEAIVRGASQAQHGSFLGMRRGAAIPVFDAFAVAGMVFWPKIVASRGMPPARALLRQVFGKGRQR